MHHNRGFHLGSFLYQGRKTVFEHRWSSCFIAALRLLTCECIKWRYCEIVVAYTWGGHQRSVHSLVGLQLKHRIFFVFFLPSGDIYHTHRLWQPYLSGPFTMLLCWLLWCTVNADFIWITGRILFLFIWMCIAGTAVSAGKLRPQLPPSTLLEDTVYKT